MSGTIVNPVASVGPNTDVSPIPNPAPDLQALTMCATATLQGLSSLGGQRGSILNKAVTLQALVNLKLVTRSQAHVASGSIATHAPPATLEALQALIRTAPTSAPSGTGKLWTNGTAAEIT